MFQLMGTTTKTNKGVQKVKLDSNEKGTSDHKHQTPKPIKVKRCLEGMDTNSELIGKGGGTEERGNRTN